jgi:hypothetical protein
MRTIARLSLLTLLGATALPCAAVEDIPTLKVFKGTPTQKGQWRVEMLQMQRGGKDASAGGVKNLSICMDSVMEMARAKREPGDQQKCSTKVLQDSPTMAQTETTCGDRVYRSTITRSGAGSYLIEGSGSGGKGEPFSMKARYAYEGPCKSGAGAVTLDKGSPQCKRMREQMARMSPDKSCAKLTDDERKMCEAQLHESMARVNAMCPE